MAVHIESPLGKQAVKDFLRFYDRVHVNQAARWPAFVSFEERVLARDSPYLEGRRVRPFVARRGGEIVARVLAVQDDRYCRHWGEHLGHLVLFEALPDTAVETRQLMDVACEWLSEQGADAARAGYGMLDLPFVIDDYESLPPSILRQNPPYYHALLKGAGFETEKGWVDYRVAVQPHLVERWQQAVAAARQTGFEIESLRRRPPQTRAAELADTWNDAFRGHWGHTPSSEGEFRFLLQTLEPGGVLDTSVVACEDGRPVGLVWAMASGASGARLAAGRQLADEERLNILAIGLRESARGKGVGLAMAALCYLELVRRGAKFLSYTLVLDDNWPSRRTAENLGAEVRANYVTYRRNLRG